MLAQLLPFAAFACVVCLVLFIGSLGRAKLVKPRASLTIGTMIFVTIAVLCFLVVLTMNVANGEVNNLGLLSDRLNLMIFGCTMMICGVLSQCANTIKNQ